MSWLFSERMCNEYLQNLQSRIFAEAQRANLLLSGLQTEKQCERSQWAENWAAVQTIQTAIDEGRLLSDVLRQASLLEWSKRNPCSCDGNGNAHRSSDLSRRVCSSQERNKDRQPIREFGIDETRRTFKRAQLGINEETQSCKGALCVSLRSLQGLVAEYSEENSWDGEPFAQLNVMPTQAKFWRNDKTMEFCNLSQFGLTLQLLTEQNGEALLTWYLGAFHAKTLAQQEKAQELKAQEAECGKKWHGLLAKYDPLTHSWKTAQCSLLEDLEQSLQTWPRWGSMRNGACYLRPMLAHLICEKESGLLPNNETFFHTPNTTGLDGGSNSRKALKKRLEQYPTPSAWDGKRGTQENWKPIRPSGHPAQYPLNQCLRDLTGINGRPNPMFCEWLMGWPTRWTDLKPLETDKFHCAQQQHLSCLEVA